MGIHLIEGALPIYIIRWKPIGHFSFFKIYISVVSGLGRFPPFNLLPDPSDLVMEEFCRRELTQLGEYARVRGLRIPPTITFEPSCYQKQRTSFHFVFLYFEFDLQFQPGSITLVQLPPLKIEKRCKNHYHQPVFDYSNITKKYTTHFSS